MKERLTWSWSSQVQQFPTQKKKKKEKTTTYVVKCIQSELLLNNYWTKGETQRKEQTKVTDNSFGLFQGICSKIKYCVFMTPVDLFPKHPLWWKPWNCAGKQHRVNIFIIILRIETQLCFSTLHGWTGKQSEKKIDCKLNMHTYATWSWIIMTNCGMCKMLSKLSSHNTTELEHCVVKWIKRINTKQCTCLL